MTRNRRIGHDPGTVLIACSICGCAYRFPTEIRRYDDGLYRCDESCKVSRTDLAEQKAVAASRARRNPHEHSIPLPGAKKPDWYP